MNLPGSVEATWALLAAWGSAAFTGVFLATAIAILLLPRRLIGQANRVPPWWRNVRFWAVLICAVQVLVYWLLG
jgi:hypothetical protein